MAKPKLTPRTVEVLRKLKAGMTQSAIAAELGITRQAVYNAIRYRPTGKPAGRPLTTKAAR